MAKNIVELLNRNMRKFPEKIAFVSESRCITNRQMWEEANRVANYLTGSGAKKGDKVSILTSNIPEFISIYFGVLKAGCVVVPINYRSQAPEIGYLVDHSDSIAIFYEDRFEDNVARSIEKLSRNINKICIGDEKDPGSLSYEKIIQSSSAVDPGITMGMDDECEIIYTSGTTGNPKGCVLTHWNVIVSCTMASIAFMLNIDSRTLCAMPLYHSAPLNLTMLGTVYVGGTVILNKEYNPPVFLSTIQKEKITHLFAAPIALLVPLMLPDFNSFDLSSMKLWIYGGGPISKENAETLMAKYKSENFMQVYGLSEAGPNGSFLAIQDQKRKAGSIGYCGSITCHMRVVDEKGEDIAAGQIGEIIISSESNMKEYYKNPKATNETIKNGWLYTGDLARMDEDGYFYIVDRKKDMIVSGGENVYTKEIEDVILTHPAVAQVAVFGIPHADWGETVAAAIVKKPDQTVEAEEIRDFLKDKLAKFKIPRIIEFRNVMPTTPTGKIMKYQLKKEHSAGK